MKARTGFASRFLFLFMALLTAFIAGCGGKGGDSTSVTSIEVTTQGGASASIGKGTKLQFKATAILSNNTTRDVTSKVEWTSTNTAHATVDNTVRKGEVTAVAPGAAGIKATLGSKSGVKIVTVTAATVKSMVITPANSSLPKGATKQLTATATLSDNTTQDVTAQAVWESSKPEFATVGNTSADKGLTQSVAEGATVIKATVGGVSASTNLTVTAVAPTSLEITPKSPTNAKGSTRQFTATATFSDGSHLDATPFVLWESSDATVATIGNTDTDRGLATTLKAGVTTIKASATVAGVTYEDATTLTVTAAELVSLQVTPTNPTVAKGLKQQFTAMATYSDASVVDITGNTDAVWSSSVEAVATVSNDTSSRGLASTVATGTSDIAVSFGGKTAKSTLTVTAATIDRIDVTPSIPSVPKGRTQKFTATAVFTDNSTEDVTATVTWASSSQSVAEIGNASGNKGRAAALNVGTSTISAALGAKSGSTTLTVTPAALTSIAVTPASAKLPAGFQKQFMATGTFTDGTTGDVTKDVTWLSSTVATATVSNADGAEGVVSAVAAGTTSITAKDPASSVQGSQTLTVTAATLTAIDVSAGNPPSATPNLPLGNSLQFNALGHFSDSSTLDLTGQVAWSSTVEATATISNAADSIGLADSLTKGVTTIKATHVASTVAGSATLTVTDAVVVSIEVAPASASVAKGLTRQFTATGAYSDGTSSDITDLVTWSSSDPAKATVSNAAGSRGLATGTGVGSATLTAALDGVSGTAALSVTDAVLQSINVTPSAAKVAKGDQPQYTATGLFSDGSTLDITGTVTWGSSDATVVQISNATDSEGLATALAPGKVDISASLDSVTGKTTLEVTTAVVRSIEIVPAAPSVPRGTSVQLSATAVYSDGTRQPATSSVNWSSSDNAIATVSNTAGSKGLVSAGNEGQVTITAADPVTSVSSTTTVKVTPAALTGIQVQPASGTGAANSRVPAGGYTLQYKAIGQYSDGSTADITTQVLWSSLNTDVATVSNTAGQKGLATSGTAGSTTLLATLNGTESGGSITVTSATLSSIAVTPTGRTLNNNTTLQFVATGTFSDSTVLVLTGQVLWTSSDTNLVTISNVEGSRGLATAVGFTLFPTNVSISAARDGKTGATTVSRAP